MKHILMALAGLVLIVVVIGFLVKDRQPSLGTTPSEETATTETNQFSWKFEEAGVGEFDAPLTKVTLVANGQSYDAGTYSGSCAEIGAEMLQENELTGVLCWWAGGGNEIGVFTEGDTLQIRVGEQSEGASDEPGFRGNFKTLISL